MANSRNDSSVDTGLGGGGGLGGGLNGPFFSAKPTSTRWLPGGEEEASAERRRFSALAVGSGCVLAAFRTCELARWYPLEQEHSEIEFARDRCSDISRVFVEPKGFHSIITSSSGDNWYLNFQSNQARSLPRLKGHVIEAIAWDPDSTPSSTKDILMGTIGGQLLHVVVEGKERVVRPLFLFETPIAASSSSSSTATSSAAKGGNDRAMRSVTGVHREHTVAVDGSPRDVIFVAAGCGIYAFMGHSLETIFQRYQGEGSTLRALVYEVPGRTARTGDIVVDSVCTGPPSSKVLFWLTGVGVVAALIQCPMQADQAVLESPPGLIPFPPAPKSRAPLGGLIESVLPKPADAPLSMALSRYHIVFLFEDRWAVVSRITHEVVQQLEWSTANYGALRCLARDPHGEQLWMCSERFLFRLVVDREDRDVWTLLLKLEQFDAALAACKMDYQRNHVLAAHADWLYRKGCYLESARKFAEATTLPFEHAALRFARPDRKAALSEYFVCRLQGCPSDGSERVPRVLLAVWAIEISIAVLHDLSTQQTHEAASRGRKAVGSQELDQIRLRERNRLHQLLRDSGDLGVHATIYHLLQSHGVVEELAVFSEARLDYSISIVHSVSRRDYAGAVEKLSDYSKSISGRSACEDLVMRFAPILFASEPKAFVSLLLQPHLDRLVSPLSVLPALVAVAGSTSGVDLRRTEAIRYLEHAIRVHPELAGAESTRGGTSWVKPCLRSAGEANNLQPLSAALLRSSSEDVGCSPAAGRGPWTSSTAVLNIMVVLLARACGGRDIIQGQLHLSPASREEEALLRFLRDQETNPLLDNQFAMRVCRERGLTRPCIQLYGALGLYSEAIEEALKHGDLERAKLNACEPLEKRCRRNLWLRIVEHQAFAAADPATVVPVIAALVRESQELSVGDVLPLLSDMITIGAFQAEICGCLDAYEDQKLTLRQEMDDHRRALQALKEDLRVAEERQIVVEEDQLCEICVRGAVLERFYAFPCRHCFHEACLRALVMPTLRDAERQRLFDLEGKRIEHQAASASALTSASGVVPGAPSAFLSASVLPRELEELEDELDGILAKDCPLCGELMIQTIQRPFIDLDEEVEASSWVIA